MGRENLLFISVYVIGIYFLFLKNDNRYTIKASYLKLGKRKIKQAISDKSFEKISNKFWKQYAYINKERYEKDIYNSLLIMKNLAIVQEELPMSRDYIIEQLMKNSNILKPAFAELLLFNRNGKVVDFQTILLKKAPLISIRRLSFILDSVDRINPVELLEYIISLEEIMAEEMHTISLKRAERNSLITTTIATITIFVLLLNFTIVVVFMDSIKLMESVF